MQLGEIVFGGVGSGLYGMIVFVVLTVFIAGLMVGRTPEYLGKKIERREVQFAILAVLVTPVLVLVPTAIAAVTPAGTATLNNAGPHGFSEILYAFTSTNANNGSAFAGLGPSLFYNLLTGVNMVFGRFAVAVPALALAGALAGKKSVPEGPGTFTTHSGIFVALLIGVIVIVGALTFLPADALGPHRRARARSARKDVLMLSQRRLERRPKPRSLFDRAIVARAVGDSFKKLDPRWQARNPVMFVVEVGAAATTIFLVRDLVSHGANAGFDFAIAAWLWFTVVFANFAEAVAEGRGKAQAEALRRTKSDSYARLLHDDGTEERVAGSSLRKGDRFVVEAGEVVPADGEVLEGAATIDESAITGESAPVVRESGGDRSAVTGGTRVLSDRIVVRVTANPGESFLDRMIRLVEGAHRQKTPNEIALSILLAGLTIIFLIAVATLAPYSIYAGAHQSVTVLIALLVCLIPTTIGGLLSAIGIAGMDRVMQRNVLAMSGRAVEAAGDVDTLLLDKTGTITLGNRQAVEIVTAAGIDPRDAAAHRAICRRWRTKRPKAARSSRWPGSRAIARRRRDPRSCRSAPTRA